jgi:MYXO-CTERM domain-containing protein
MTFLKTASTLLWMALIAGAAPAQVAVNRLPDPASSLPLIALCGLLALGGALAVRFVQRRSP